ncbi:MAG: T9SS type A sorting domain-containing protein [Candidatus Lokiarchaeota archaeon]|nr:T9SS type A sorting domain-containing protein [Candidatus Lokiarchaeota archaeon]
MKKAIILISILGLLEAGFCQEDNWVRPCPAVITNSLNDIYILDSTSAVAVGYGGLIVKTTDRGITWYEQNSNTSEALYSVNFVDDKNGWTVGKSGTILRTNDGGKNWNIQQSGTSCSLYGVYFTTKDIGWVVGYKRIILKTTNGGKNWLPQHNESVLTYLEDVFFVNANQGVAVGSNGTGKIYRTLDGGENWIESSLGCSWVKDVYFIDELRGWATGIVASRITISTGFFGEINIDIENPRSTIWDTNDGGVNWNQTTFSSNEFLEDIFFLNESIGWAVGDSGTIVKTIDGGNSWLDKTNNADRNLKSVQFFSPNVGLAVCEDRQIIKSFDGGSTWEEYSRAPYANLCSVYFTNKDKGWAAGFLRTGMIFQTNDGGFSWSETTPDEQDYADLYTIFFIDSTTGWTSGRKGIIFKTIDSGESWIEVADLAHRINSIYFVNNQIGWVGGSGGYIAKTISGGDSWNVKEMHASDNINSIYFINSEIGFAVGEDGYFVTTVDGGENWRRTWNLPHIDFHSVYFINSQLGWIVGDEGTICKTNDGGSTWAKMKEESGVYSPLYSVYFVNPQVGWAVGRKILKSEDGGNSWNVEKLLNSRKLKAITFIDSNVGYAVGEKGLIFKNIHQPKGINFKLAGKTLYYSSDSPIENTKVSLSGKSVLYDTTNVDGHYHFEKLSLGKYCTIASKENEINDAITPYDAALILQQVVDMRDFTPYQMIAADVSGNGDVSAYDASQILRYCVGIIPRFPIMQDDSHFWKFVPDNFPTSNTNWSIAPDSILYDSLNSDMNDQDFIGIVYGDPSGNWKPLAGLTTANKRVEKYINLEFGKVDLIENHAANIPILMEQTGGVFSIFLDLKYDKNIIEIINITKSENTKDLILTYNIKGNNIKIALAGNKPIKENGAIVTIECHFKNIKDYANSISIIEGKVNEGDFYVNIEETAFNLLSKIPQKFKLCQNYPNPFNPETTINYQLPSSCDVTIDVYNLRGQLVKTIIDQNQSSGYYSTAWNGKDNDGRDVPSGLYLYRINAKVNSTGEDFVKIRKMLYIK